MESPPNAGIPGGHIESLLRQIGFPFTRDAVGNYQVAVGIGDGRSQVVVIDAAVQAVDGGDVVRISSVAYECDCLIPEGIANSLLALNSTTRIGAWCIQRGGERQRFAAYIAKVPIGENSELLRFVLLEVADMADHIESQLSGVDRY